MKKILCIIVAVMLLALCFASCGGNDPGNESKAETASKADTTSTAASTPEQGGESETEVSVEVSEADPWRDSDGKYMSPIEIKDVVAEFGPEFTEFHVLVKGKANATYQSDDFTTGSELYGDTLDTAVTQRNNYIFDTYGVTIVPHKEDNINQLILEDLSSGNNYDLVMPNLPYLATLAADGSLLDLKTLNNMNIDAPWYDQNANETFSMNHQLFFTTGDITILNKVCAIGMLFGKELYNLHSAEFEDLYQLVRDHKWTYDKMKEMAKAVTADTDGEPGMSVNDTWGFLTSYGDAVNLYGGAGQHLCQKDSNDYPYFSLGSDERSQTILRQILTDLAEPNTWRVFAQEFPPDIWVTSLDAIEEGRILFRPSAFSAITKLRIRGVDFGIIPLPLWDEEQEEYYSYCGTGQTAGFGILTSCRNQEYSAYMTDVISAASKNYVTRAYMEVNLKSKDLPDDNDLEMLEIIFGSILYDIGDVNNFGSINGLIQGLVSSGSTDLTSTLAANRDAIEAKIDEVIEAYESLQ